MLEIQRIREAHEPILAGMAKRNLAEAPGQIARVLEVDKERRTLLAKVEALRNEMNTLSKSIGMLMGQGKKEEAETAKGRTTDIKAEIKATEESLEVLELEQHQILLGLPNCPSEKVPPGGGPEDNLTVSSHGEIPTLFEGALAHWDLCKNLGIIDFEAGAKLTGSGFPVYMGQGARLVRALIQFFLDEAEKAGYLEIIPPLMVNESSGYATGQLPDKEGQMYHATVDDLYLIPTAEVPITNLYRDTLLEFNQLPVKNCGYTPCFRREAGAAGKDTRGLNRLHQFDKVEIVELSVPEKSYERLEAMRAHSSSLLEKLELPYRVLLLCGGDMGFASAMTYDLEVWSAAQGRWLEVSSVSCFETFQSNRMKCRYRDENGKTRLVHTLNGSALALPRVMAALMENHQQTDGSIRIPAALVPYTGFDRIIKR